MPAAEDRKWQKENDNFLKNVISARFQFYVLRLGWQGRGWFWGWFSGISKFTIPCKKTYAFKQSGRLLLTSINGKRETLQHTQMETVQPSILTISLTKCTPFIKFSTPGCKCGCQDSDELYLIYPGNQVSITFPPSLPYPLEQHIVMAAENLKIILYRARWWDNGRLPCPFSSLRLVISCDTELPLYRNCKTAITKQ